MTASRSPRFQHKALATAVATALLPGLAHGAAGRVDFAYGDVKNVKPSGLQQRLRKGSQIEQGDTIVTARGRAQIRFSDGARTSLLPNSEFRVDTYQFEEEKEEESQGFFSLLKGGLRTITGVIGKLRQSAYQVTTPSATIGIRGTEYLVVLGNSANIWVGDGQIEACNNGGCQTFQGGESGYVADQNTKPIHTPTKPVVTQTEWKPVPTPGDLGVDDPPFSSAEDVDQNGVSTALPEGSEGSEGSDDGPFDDGAFYTLAVSVGDSFEGTAIDQAGLPPSELIDATFSGNELRTYAGTLNGNVGTASVLEAGGDGTIGWGRWAMGTIDTDVDVFSPPVTLSGSESHHYAIGLPTREVDMPSGTGSYSLLDGTTPTYADGSGTGTLNTASLNVDFDTSQVDVNINFSIGGNTFDMNSGASPMGSGSASHTFSDSGGFTSSSACSGGCSTSIEGFFAGAGASRAGVVYKVFDDSVGESVNGAAGFTKSGTGTPISPPETFD